MSKRQTPKPTPTKADLERRAEIISKPHYCDNWNQHPQHTMEMRMANWLGGGTEIVTCPGNKREHPKF